MSTELEQLTAQFDADITRFENKMTAMGVAFDRQSQEIQRSQSDLVRKLNASWGGVSDIGAALGIGLSIAGVTSFFDKVTDGATKLKQLSTNTGLSVEELQEYQIAAQKVGVGQDDLNESLDRFSKNLGDAVNGNKKLQTVFNALGIDIHGPVDQAFLKLADDLTEIPDIQQRNSVAALLLGKNWATTLPFLLEGSDAIRQQGVQAAATGQIISTQMNDKIDDLGAKWAAAKREIETIETKALATAADQFEQMDITITDQQFQTAIQNVASVMAEIATALIQIAQHKDVLATLAGAAVGARVLGVPGALLGGAAGYSFAEANNGANAANFTTVDQGNAYIAQLQQQKAAAVTTASSYEATPNIPGFDSDTDPQTNVQDTATIKSLDAEIAAAEQRLAKIKSVVGQAANTTPPKAKATLNLPPNLLGNPGDIAKQEQAIKDALARIAVDKAKADTEEVTAEDKLNVQLLEGKSGYYDAVQKEIADELAAKITAINAEYDAQVDSLGKLKNLSASQRQEAMADITAEKTAKIAAATAESQAATDNAGQSGLLRQGQIQASQQIKQYADQEAAIGLLAGAAAKYAFVQGQINDATAKGITLSPEALKAIDAEGDAISIAAQSAKSANDIYQDQIALSDGLRDGLENVAESGTQGFSSLVSASAQFAQQLAALIIKLYLMGPLLKTVFGEPGTAGGGLFGSLLSDLGVNIGAGTGGVIAPVTVTPSVLGGYANGTDWATPGLHEVGEEGPELLDVPRGSQVIPHDDLVSMQAPKIAARPANINAPITVVMNMQGALDSERVSTIARTYADAAAKAVATKVLSSPVLGPAVKRASRNRFTG